MNDGESFKTKPRLLFCTSLYFHQKTSYIEIYKKHLKSKLPFKSFFYSKSLAYWCSMEDIFFKSEENCRINKDLMLKAWNKKYPQDKITDKKKK